MTASGQLLGYTMNTSFTATCTCAKCDSSSTTTAQSCKLDHKIATCTISNNFGVVITTEPLPAGHTLSGVYGHEQMHVNSIISEAMKVAANHEYETGKCLYPTMPLCQKSADELAAKLAAEANAKWGPESDHANPGSPKDGTDYPPKTPLPASPSTAPYPPHNGAP
jgi:hypothetical protein